MERTMDSKQVFQIWAQYRKPEAAHIALDRLYGFSKEGGLQQATLEEMKHLSMCPACLDQWAAFQADTAPCPADAYDKKPAMMGGGILKAAASELTDPLSIQSECKNLTLGIFPDIDDPDTGMAVLEITGQDLVRSCDGKGVCVRDNQGKVILKNKIRHGRAASRISSLGDLDFSQWTFTIDK